MPLDKYSIQIIRDKIKSGKYYVAIDDYSDEYGQKLYVIDKKFGIESTYVIENPRTYFRGRFMIISDTSGIVKEGGFAYIENGKYYISQTALTILGPFQLG
jgi:hypothetical protein